LEPPALRFAEHDLELDLASILGAGRKTILHGA
jgi:hypothetical protein